jgi:hypothetical protein
MWSLIVKAIFKLFYIIQINREFIPVNSSMLQKKNAVSQKLTAFFSLLIIPLPI